MQSHRYQIDQRVWVEFFAPLFSAVGVIALLLHAGAWAGVLPRPRPALDMDRTILVHQGESSRRAQSADVLLVGDSSCLMDVDARALSAALGRPVLNLGTISFLGLGEYGLLVQEFARANPGSPQAVVLLMHPNNLRLGATEAYHIDSFRRFLAGRDAMPAGTAYDWVSAGLGLDTFRGRILGRVLPTALPKEYGRVYGFTSGLESYMAAHGGSAEEVVREPMQGSAEYRLSRGMEAACREFRGQLPSGVRFFAVMTPVAASLARADYETTSGGILAEWSEWLGAEGLKVEAVMPDEEFGRPTHLGGAGAKEYTRKLGEKLNERLREAGKGREAR